MLTLLLAATLTLTPATQTIVLASKATVTAVITPVGVTPRLAWSATPAGVRGKAVGLTAKPNLASAVNLNGQMSSTVTQTTEWTFDKQGTYNLILTVTSADGSIARQGVTVNVKRK